MAISVRCAGCSATFQAKMQLAGRSVPCPKCGHKIPIVAEVTPAATQTAKQTAPPQATAATHVRAKSAQPASAGSGTRTTLTYDQLQSRILAAFQGNIEQARVPLSYRLAAFLVALVMILLPLVYVGLIILAGFCVYYHAVHHTGMLQTQAGRAYLFVLLAYLAPMAIGTILVVFMIKPLFSRPMHQGRERSLTRDGEPLLFAFVDRICETVGAPRPRRIDLDCQINASAGFRRGVLSFWGNDLVLTIGLPLVAGLSLRQFAGVLAHEFGHFSQGAGMRLSYIIRSIAYWLQRVVYERDHWDEALHNAARSVDFRIGWVLYLAQFFVWVTRKILWVLMLIGYGVAGYLLRQMEFDADRYEARVSGSEVFESTARRLNVLGVAYQGAQSDLAEFYAEGRLGDNLPRLIQENVKQIPKRLLRQINQAIDKSKTGLFDTHPCDRDRIENAKHEEAAGVFHLEQPARLLFRDFDDASRKVTWDLYRGIFGPKLTPQELHPIDPLLAGQKKDHQAFESLGRFFQGEYSPSRSVKLPKEHAYDATTAKEGARLLQRMRKAIVQDLEQVRSLAAERDKALTDMDEAMQVSQLLDAGIQLSPKDFKCSVSGPVAQSVIRKNRDRIMILDGQIASWEDLVMQRLRAAIGLLFCAPFAKRIPQVELLQQRCTRLLPVARQLQAGAPMLVDLKLKYTCLLCLLPALEKNAEDSIFVRQLLKQMGGVCDAVNSMREAFRVVPYPFDHAETGMTVARYLLKDPLVDRENLQQIYEAPEGMLDRYMSVTSRAVAQLTLMAEAVEDALGLERLPDPPEEVEGADDSFLTSE